MAQLNWLFKNKQDTLNQKNGGGKYGEKKSGTWYLQEIYCKAHRTLRWPSCNTAFKYISFLHIISEAVAPGKAASWLYLQIQQAESESHSLKVTQVKNTHRIVQMWSFHSWAEISSPHFIWQVFWQCYNNVSHNLTLWYSVMWLLLAVSRKRIPW